MIGNVSCCNAACNAQTRRFPIAWLAVPAKQCEAIHGGVRERRDIFLSYNILSQYQSQCLGQGYLCAWQGLNFVEYACQSLFYADHSGLSPVLRSGRCREAWQTKISGYAR